MFFFGKVSQFEFVGHRVRHFVSNVYIALVLLQFPCSFFGLVLSTIRFDAVQFPEHVGSLLV